MIQPDPHPRAGLPAAVDIYEVGAGMATVEPLGGKETS